MTDSRDLSPQTANHLATLLSYLVQREGGMVVLPAEREVRDTVRGTQLSIHVDEARNKVVITLVPAVDPHA